MNIPATIDLNFERILKKLQNILEGNIASNDIKILLNSLCLLKDILEAGNYFLIYHI